MYGADPRHLIQSLQKILFEIGPTKSPTAWCRGLQTSLFCILLDILCNLCTKLIPGPTPLEVGAGEH